MVLCLRFPFLVCKENLFAYHKLQLLRNVFNEPSVTACLPSSSRLIPDIPIDRCKRNMYDFFYTHGNWHWCQGIIIFVHAQYIFLTSFEFLRKVISTIFYLVILTCHGEELDYRGFQCTGKL